VAGIQPATFRAEFQQAIHCTNQAFVDIILKCFIMKKEITTATAQTRKKNYFLKVLI